MRLLWCFLGSVLAVCLVPLVQSVKYEPNWSSIDSRPLPAWYDKAKVGIFIHFGVFSVPSYVDEWFWSWWLIQKDPRIVAFMKKNYKPGFTYPDFAPQFKTEFFDAQQWAKLFAQSGAKYVVLTTKHHEGFTLWPSKYSPHWNAHEIGPKRDILGELAHAVRESGLPFGTYYSLMEWFHPMYVTEKKEKFNTTREFVELKIRPEMEELVNTYKPDVFWSDGAAEAPDSYWKSADFLAWLYNESPVKDVVVVNDRWGKGTGQKHGGFYVGPDRFHPGKLVPHKWENAMTIDKHSWGFRREANLNDYMTIEVLLYELVSSVAYGGNLLINVGPTADGRIRPIFEERLLQLGEWLQLNGEGIYESTPWAVCQKDSVTGGVWYTQKDAHTVYAFAQKWHEAGFAEFGCINRAQVASVKMLGSESAIRTEKGHTGTVVHFPQWNPLLKAKHVFAFKFTLL